MKEENLWDGLLSVTNKLKTQTESIQNDWKNSYFPGIAVDGPKDYIAVTRNSMMRFAIAFDKKLDEYEGLLQFNCYGNNIKERFISKFCPDRFKQLYNLNVLEPEFSMHGKILEYRDNILILKAPLAAIIISIFQLNMVRYYIFTLDGTIDLLRKDIESLESLELKQK